MRARLSTRVIGLAALLPLLVVAVSGLGYDRFRCAFTGEVTEAGCCPVHDAPAAPVVSAASCCDHESARVERAPAEPAAPRDVAFAAPALAARGPALALAPAPRADAPRAGAQAPPSPPLLLLKQSFLI